VGSIPTRGTKVKLSEILPIDCR